MNGHEHDPVLELALEQELRREAPPDLCARLLAPAQPPARNRIRTRWATAAMLLLALGLVVAIAWQAGARDRTANDRDQDPLPWHENLAVPRSPEEAKHWIGVRSGLIASMFAVRDPASGRLVAFRRHPLEGWSLFGADRTEPRVTADPLQDAQWSAAVLDVLSRPSRPAPAYQAHPLELAFDLDDRGTLVIGIDDRSEPARLQVQGLPLAWAIPRGAPLPQALRNATEPLVGPALIAFGIALGRDGLDALPPEQTSIRGHGLRPGDLATLARFEKLRSLDLTGSPAAVTPAALAHLRACPSLRSITLPAEGIGFEHLVALVNLPALAELFIGDPMAASLRPLPQRVNEIDDRCAALLASASGLSELGLPVTDLTDAGLARLAELPLRNLLIGSPHVTGTGIAAFRASTTLRNLSLHRCTAATEAGLRAVADLPTRVDVGLVGMPLDAPRVTALLDGPVRGELGLTRCSAPGGWPRVLAAIAAARTPRELGVSGNDRLAFEDLTHLAGARSLEKIEFGTSGPQPPDAELAIVRAALPGVSIDAWSVPR